MQNLITEKQSGTERLNKPEIKKQFKNSDALKFYKGSNDSLVGLEYERITLDRLTLGVPEYDKVAKVIEHFAKILNWELIFDNDTIIGAKNNSGTSISLEPGLQFEISLAPKKSIVDIETELTKIISLLDKIAKLYNIFFFEAGINPSQSDDEIKLLEKNRYKIMDKYLPLRKKGEFCPKMMRKTAGIQVNIDYKNSKDAYLKLKFFNIISPFMTALFASSPFENGHLTLNKSNRALAWLYTGSERCNLFYKNVFEHKFGKYNNFFKNYISEVFKVPVLFIEREGRLIPFNCAITFAEYAKNGYNGHFATYEDYILHQSLTFPNVRLKNYIEIRNHDSQNPRMALGLCAFYKGLSKCNMENLLKHFSYLKINDVENYDRKIITKGLDIKISNKTGWDIAAELFNISRKKLSAMDRFYLEPVFEMLKSRKTTADLIMDYNISSVGDLVEFLE